MISIGEVVSGEVVLEGVSEGNIGIVEVIRNEDIVQIGEVILDLDSEYLLSYWVVTKQYLYLVNRSQYDDFGWTAMRHISPTRIEYERIKN